MTTGTAPRGGRNSPPKEFAQTPPPQAFDQFSIMQSIMEIQKDVTRIALVSEQVVAELKDLKATSARVEAKVGRAEAIVIAGGTVIVVFGLVLWWLFGAPITYLRDQMIIQQPTLNSTQAPPAIPSVPNP